MFPYSALWFDGGYTFMSVDRGLVCCSELQKIAENPQLQFIDGGRISCRGAEANSHGLAVQQTIVVPRLQFLNEVIDVPVVLVVQVFILVVALRSFPMVQTAVGP